MEFLGGVLAGIFVALIVQLVTAVHLRPILDIREIIGEVAVSLIYYANVYGQLGAAERKKEAQEAFLEHGSKGELPFLWKSALRARAATETDKPLQGLLASDWSVELGGRRHARSTHAGNEG